MKTRSGAKKIKTIQEIDQENAKIFGKKRGKKASFDSVKVLRELRD